ncbi:ATP-binding protein [Kitasatospora sp. NPDC091257]|uniref:ATP-binding protein n=1 Tax=Kitasatospora sp. NPDC091257 TaxID=3364084 RepID=UPI00382A87CF
MPGPARRIPALPRPLRAPPVDRITVEVSDNGTAASADTPVGALAGAGGAAGPRAGRTGYGLIGMRERVALHGGSLVAGGVDGGGFRVVASLPVAPVDGEERLGRRKRWSGSGY